MDDSLIAAVYRREPLWNPLHKLHKNVNVLKSLWEEVGEETGRDVKIIKTRWKNLRAYYVKECQKTPKTKKGFKRENYPSTWQYFQTLSFLGTTFNNVDKQSFDDNTDDSNSTSLVDVDDSFDAYREQLYPIVNIESGYEFRVPSPQSPRNKRRRSMEEPTLDQKDELERTKVDLLQQEAVRRNNDDLLFFESLLPYVKDIPLARKLRLRSAIQDLISKELEQISNDNNDEKQIECKEEG